MISKLALMKKLLRGMSGQAMAEYSTITFWLLGTGALMLTRFLPSMIGAVGDYMHGVYFTLALPFP
jgi:hypothetical protein